VEEGLIGARAVSVHDHVNGVPPFHWEVDQRQRSRRQPRNSAHSTGRDIEQTSQQQGQNYQAEVEITHNVQLQEQQPQTVRRREETRDSMEDNGEQQEGGQDDDIADDGPSHAFEEEVCQTQRQTRSTSGLVQNLLSLLQQQIQQQRQQMLQSQQEMVQF